MNRRMKKISNNLMLKSISCMLGLLCWLKYSYHTPVQHSITLPISFYNTAENQIIDAPEHIQAHVKAPRPDLYLLDASTCALHIDAQHLKVGLNKVHITSRDICLPEALTVVNYSPSSILVNLK